MISMSTGVRDASSITPSCADKRRSILIALGPTAGHIHPALAFIDNYRAAFGDMDVCFAAAPLGPADELLMAHGLSVEHVTSSPIANTNLWSKLIAGPHVVEGIVQAQRMVRAHGARLVVGFGGYATGAVLLAARTLGVTTVLHEANTSAGLANSMLSQFVDHAYVGWPSTVSSFRHKRCTVIGTPIRPEIAQLAGMQRCPPGKNRPAHVLVLSGTWGASFMATQAPQLMASLQSHGVSIEVRHQSEAHDAPALLEVYRHMGINALVTPFLDDIAAAYQWADFVLTRSGAGVLAEIAAAGLPALLVPLSDAAADHQRANALAYASHGAAVTVCESEWDLTQLTPRIEMLLMEQQTWLRASASARSLAKPDAAMRMVFGCEAIMDGHW